MSRATTPSRAASMRIAWTAAEVAAQLGVTRQWVLTLAGRGELDSFRSGRRVLFPTDAPAEYVARQRAAQRALLHPAT